MRNHLTENGTEMIEFAGLIGHLVRDGLLDIATASTITTTLSQQATTLTNYLVKENILSSQIILDFCAKKFGLPIFDSKNFIYTQTDSVISPEVILHYRVLPLNREQDNLYLGVTDPTNHSTLAAIGFHTGLRIRPMLMGEAELDHIINTYYRPSLLNSHVEVALSKIVPLDDETDLPAINASDDEPVSEFVNRLIQSGLDKQVSDIHIEPYEKYCRIRFRRDGLLTEVTTIPLHLAARITTRLKILANLNIAERRLPQDGRFPWQHTTKLDIRINTCPILFGEKLVLRLLDKRHIHLDIDALGFTSEQKKLFLAKLAEPQGLILVTGPTGSGKTITLYSALHYLNTIEKNISSVEDPVEIDLPGINQVSIHPKIGLDFASILRTFLRQDPDIVMVGEIRDRETADIALQAAQTGHLVLSTLHTNNAIEAITRLQSMQVAAFHMSSVSLIIAQRLVRKLCQHCKQPSDLSAKLMRDLFQLPADETSFTHHPVGCEHCHQGYAGRIGIFEVLPITENLMQAILTNDNHAHLALHSLSTTWPSLWEIGLANVRAGITTLAEILRVIGPPASVHQQSKYIKETK